MATACTFSDITTKIKPAAASARTGRNIAALHFVSVAAPSRVKRYSKMALGTIPLCDNHHSSCCDWMVVAYLLEDHFRPSISPNRLFLELGNCVHFDIGLRNRPLHFGTRIAANGLHLAAA